MQALTLPPLYVSYLRMLSMHISPHLSHPLVTLLLGAIG